MDRLFETAQKGNVEELRRLLSENPLILHQVGLTCTENPLHYVSTSGHLDYAKEMLKLKPKFAEELNPEGYSPAHLASANGYIEIVREMIKVNPMLFCRKGRDGKTPLHFAVSKGRVDVIQEVLANCGDSMEVVTVQGETALHLAVKNYQVKSFRVMMDWVRHTNKEHIVNMKDDHGNTILHLAVWKKQRQVLESLFEKGPGIVEVNATNSSGLTALDLLSIFPSEAGDREIHELLQSVGASKSQNGSSDPTPIPIPVVPIDEHDFIQHFKFHKGRDSPSDVRSTLLVIAVLVATATYQLGLNPPGDVWQDDGQGHMAGTSILGTYNLVIYDLLIAFNSIGFCVSLYMIDKLTSKFPLQTELQICLLALYLTYNMAVPAISPPKAKVFINIFTSALPIVVPISCKLLRKYRVVSRVVGMFRRS
ncbi:ankyrin repeat-containing protein BDA1-like [Silene latifolia]|uniref:ankyrin repeat-containing protein BDA1-like n=1 Tax=Silene latifolia TaxID=37657 RepID=UPI003D77DAF7